MIKTECGEMIEPRVYDWLLHKDGRKLLVTSTNISQLKPDTYTLLHRPFQVGNEIEIRKPAIKQWGGFAYADNIIHDEKMRDQCNSLSADLIRHKNPAWRTHSEWKAEA